jgi:hypothetical protein
MSFDEQSFNDHDRSSLRSRMGQNVVTDEERKEAIARAKNGGEEKPFAHMTYDAKWDEDNMLPGQKRYRNRMARLGDGLNHVGEAGPEDF